jgi:hypothetical protein
MAFIPLIVAVAALIYRAPQKLIHNFESLKIFAIITRELKNACSFFPEVS